VVRKLTTELFFHGHPINRQEAREDVGLDFVKDAPPEVEQAMWELFVAYEEEMHLNEAFQPVQDAIAQNPLPVPPSPDPTLSPVAAVPLDTLKLAYVESTARCDVFEADYEVTLRRDYSGLYGAQVGLMRQAWTLEN
jgi:hypothetical protein